MNSIRLQFEYEWTPFAINGRHLIFHEYEKGIKLEREECSHWGSVVYKWEGMITEGERKGKTGILIGETDDIRARLNQYKSGTQEKGNKYWREHFLIKGDIYLWAINLKKCFLDGTAIDR